VRSAAPAAVGSQIIIPHADRNASLFKSLKAVRAFMVLAVIAGALACFVAIAWEMDRLPPKATFLAPSLLVLSGAMQRLSTVGVLSEAYLHLTPHTDTGALALAGFLVILGLAVYADKIHKPLAKYCNYGGDDGVTLSAEWKAGFVLATVAVLFYLIAAVLAVVQRRTSQDSTSSTYNPI
jgi:hypothetical protein